MQPSQGANPYAPQQPVVTGHPVSVGMGVPVVGQFFPPTSAVVALVLACLSFVFCGIFMSIPALIMAGQALQITSSMPGHPDHGTAKAAQIVAWVNIGLTIAGVILYAAAIGFFAMNGDF
ncbi:MAG: hypothetical protein NZ802_05370 [Candidatus Poseidoniales archaeon]|nr:hypothetical protein [Candidatus Poseidoniales archaeon]